MRIRLGFVVLFVLVLSNSVYSQTYRNVYGWADSINDRIEDFLNSTLIMEERKVYQYRKDLSDRHIVFIFNA